MPKHTMKGSKRSIKSKVQSHTVKSSAAKKGFSMKNMHKVMTRSKHVGKGSM